MVGIHLTVSNQPYTTTSRNIDHLSRPSPGLHIKICGSTETSYMHVTDKKVCL